MSDRGTMGFIDDLFLEQDDFVFSDCIWEGYLYYEMCAPDQELIPTFRSNHLKNSSKTCNTSGHLETFIRRFEICYNKEVISLTAIAGINAVCDIKKLKRAVQEMWLQNRGTQQTTSRIPAIETKSKGGEVVLENREHETIESEFSSSQNSGDTHRRKMKTKQTWDFCDFFKIYILLTAKTKIWIGSWAARVARK